MNHDGRPLCTGLGARRRCGAATVMMWCCCAVICIRSTNAINVQNKVMSVLVWVGVDRSGAKLRTSYSDELHA